MAWAVPTQRQRQDRAQHGECAQQVDGPEATAIAIAKPDRALIEPAVLHFDGRDHGLEALWGLGQAHRLQWLPMDPQEQQTLDDLVQCHRYPVAIRTAWAPHFCNLRAECAGTLFRPQ